MLNTLLSRFIILEANILDWHIVLRAALTCGLVLSVALTALSVISGAIALDMFVDKYPPDVRQKYGPMSAKAARLRPYAAALLFITILGIPMLGLLALHAEINSVSFLPALVFSGIALLVFNTFDLIILDWLFFCTIQPQAMILPGTEGLAGYRDYRFHFIGFLKGLGFTLVGSLLIAILWMLLYGLLP